jgi:C-8 sterol isomerase
MRYCFEPYQLQDIARRAVGRPFDEMVQVLTDDLAAAYPGYIETRQDWVFSLAGGITGIMTVLHASLSEYVLLFGSPIGTEGFSGRYHIDIWDITMAGLHTCYSDDRPGERRVYPPGDMAVLYRGQTKAVRLSENSWLLEYARGPIPTALPMALMDTVFSALDGTILAKTLWIYGRQVVKSLLKGKI